MRTVAVVTTSRADYGIYRPVLRQLASEASVDLLLIVGGSHLSPAFGLTVREIVADGFSIDERVECSSRLTTPRVPRRRSAWRASASRRPSPPRPDVVVVLGDRFEMYAAAVAALPFRSPSPTSTAVSDGGRSTSVSVTR